MTTKNLLSPLMEDVLETVMGCYSEEVDGKVCFINDKGSITYRFDSIAEAEHWLYEKCFHQYMNID